jgi:hypothetical protein
MTLKELFDQITETSQELEDILEELSDNFYELDERLDEMEEDEIDKDLLSEIRTFLKEMDPVLGVGAKIADESYRISTKLEDDDEDDDDYE